MRNGRGRRAASGGFAYIGLLTFVTVLGISLGVVSEVWSFSAQREREAELLFIGDQYRRAITLFYTASANGVRGFPHTLDELLEDNRDPEHVKHYLRRLYPDPMTGKADWGVVTLPSGGIVGVYSQSTQAPIKRAGFLTRDSSFVDQTRYADWVFRSELPAANPVTNAKIGSGTSKSLQPQPLPQGPIRSTPGAGPGAAPGNRQHLLPGLH